MIAYEDAAAAIDWLTAAFGFTVQVDDLDTHHGRAVEAGANVIRPPEDAEFAGMRLYTAEDLEGHRWMFGQRFETEAA